MNNNIVHRRRVHYPFASLYIAVLMLLGSGCTTLGPDFAKPDVPEPGDWLQEQEQEQTFQNTSFDSREWWKVFNDPALDSLVDTAYRQNLSLQVAGLRILEARAQLGIATGLQYPQQQSVGGSAQAVGLSENSPNFFSGFTDTSFKDYQLGFDAAWELDFWGRYRRGIESAESNLSATVADYDNALVSLTAEVARVYVTIRTLQERLAIALNNIKLQEESLRIADVRFRNGATTELDVQQARSNLADTQAQVPALQRSLRQAMNGLSILLGMPPANLTDMLGETGSIPVAPTQVAVGIPAELLRRRPDVRSAEMLASSRSALIGVAETDLYPRFGLLGSIGYQTSDTGSSSASDLFDSDSLGYSVGPSFTWNILNYGRIRNNVRVEDARYQQTLVNYQDTVIKAYQEVEDAMIGFVKSQEETVFRANAATASKRSTEIANIQYREGAVDFQRVIDTERALVLNQDRWTSSRGAIVLNLIAMYKALGGGWEIREGHDFISEQNRSEMQNRTNWGELLDSSGEEGEAVE
jgi:NodT family efflux transporter outer membrane factor (OMF) lipoprotein